jgi:hypothetical protein
MLATKKIGPNTDAFTGPEASPPNDPSERSISVREFNDWVSGANHANRDFRRTVDTMFGRQRVWILSLAGCLMAETVVIVVMAIAVWR